MRRTEFEAGTFKETRNVCKIFVSVFAKKRIIWRSDRGWRVKIKLYLYAVQY